jgi:tight adherence protein B
VRNALIVVLALTLLGLLEAGYHALRYLSERRGRELRRRLQAVGAPPPLDASLLRQGRLSTVPVLDAWLGAMPWARWLERLLGQADAQMTVAQVLSLSAAGVAAGLIAGHWTGLWAGATIAVLLAAAPVAFLVIRRERRSRALSEQLPEALEMMARSLRAGHALSGAFQLVATEMPEPVNVEFARAFEEQRLGMPLERAVREMAARAPTNGDLKIFAVSTVIQKETGGNLAEILDNIARTIRDRYRFYGKLRSLTAESRASAWVVSLLPLGLAAFLAATQPQYMGLLVDDPLGRTYLAAGVFAWATGVLWFQRLTKLDY